MSSVEEATNCPSCQSPHAQRETHSWGKSFMNCPVCGYSELYNPGDNAADKQGGYGAFFILIDNQFGRSGGFEKDIDFNEKLEGANDILQNNEDVAKIFFTHRDQDNNWIETTVTRHSVTHAPAMSRETG